ncbi:MAG: cation diffusion facilitator family transporter [Thermoplasmata archaeon]|nr:cation diffusion facilitator family transporter [Thermoplasmata archaeon]
MPDVSHGEDEVERTVIEALRAAVAFSIVILIVESVGAYLSRSLSLSVDAAHNIPDVIAFALSYAALRGAEQGTSDAYTFGRHRGEVFAGLANAALVLATGLAFAYEALATFARGGTFAGAVDPRWLLLGVVPTLALRATSLMLLRRIPGRVRDLNFRSVGAHVSSDLLIAGAILVVGAVLFLSPSLVGVDPVVTLGIAAVLVIESAPLFRDSWEVLTERTPRHLSVDAVSRTALGVPGVRELHDVHIWAVCPTLICMTAHVRIDEMSVGRSMDVVEKLRVAMERDHGILHAVFQVESRSEAS